MLASTSMFIDLTRKKSHFDTVSIAFVVLAVVIFSAALVSAMVHPAANPDEIIVLSGP